MIPRIAATVTPVSLRSLCRRRGDEADRVAAAGRKREFPGVVISMDLRGVAAAGILKIECKSEPVRVLVETRLDSCSGGIGVLPRALYSMPRARSRANQLGWA